MARHISRGARSYLQNKYDAEGVCLIDDSPSMPVATGTTEDVNDEAEANMP